MTAAEKRQMRKMEIRIEELEKALKRSNEVWADQFTTIYETRAVMRQAYEAILDAVLTMRQHMANDPAFMQMEGELLNG